MSLRGERIRKGILGNSKIQRSACRSGVVSSVENYMDRVQEQL
jgi:hypothetical protein